MTAGSIATVAVKVLPAELSGDLDWKRRLEREAKTRVAMQSGDIASGTPSSHATMFSFST